MAYPDWVLKRNISYRAATHEDTIFLFQKVKPGIDVAMYRNHSSLSTIIMKAYEQRQLRIKDRLLTSKSRISISCDIWTSSNNMALLSVIAHLIDSENRRHSILIGLPRIFGSHTGENIADTVCKVLGKYEISDRIGCFMMDNAGNNDTTIDSLIERIPSLKRRARLRCVGHIFNLVVKAILYGKGINDFEKRILGCSDREHFDLWRRFGAIGKIHNFVKWICRSTKRREEFADDQALAMAEDEVFDWVEKMLVKDGGVRWNSTYMMLKRAKLLRRAIEWFQLHHENDDDDELGYGAQSDKITKEDWEEVDRFLSVLEPIAILTKELESNPGTTGYGSLWAVFPALDILSDILDETITSTKDNDDSYFKSGLLMGKQKLDQYWDKMSQETPFYFAATILHPSLREGWFKDKWRKFPEWIKRGTKQTERLFQEYADEVEFHDEVVTAQSSVSSATTNRNSTASTSQHQLQPRTLKNHLKHDRQYSSYDRSSKRRKLEREYDKYCR
jgi:hypothetical protein